MAFPSGWTRQCALTVDHTKVGSGGVSGFPLVFTEASLPSEMLDSGSGHPALDGGADIRFTSDMAGTTQLAVEVVTCDTGAHTAEIWVLVPTLSDSADTTIYVWYGNSSATMPAANSTYGSQAVWDSGHLLVHHLAQDPGGSAPQMLDSTVNAVNGTTTGMSGADLIAGGIGDGLHFDGASKYVDFGNVPLDSLIGSGDFDFSAVFQCDNGSGDTPPGDGNGGGGTLMNIQGDSGPSFQMPYSFSSGLASQGEMVLAIYGATFPTDYASCNVGTGAMGSPLDCRTAKAWIAWGRLSGSFYFHINGVPLTVTNAGAGTGQATAFPTLSTPLRLGRYSYASTTGWLGGMLDEFRMVKAARPAAWNLTRFNAESSPGTFAAAGSPGTPGGSGGATMFRRTFSRRVGSRGCFGL